MSIDYSLKENWSRTMLIDTLETHCVLSDEEKESFDRLWVSKLDCEKVTGTIIRPAITERLYDRDSEGKEGNDFILVESQYWNPFDAKEKPDAVAFTVGQFVGNEQPEKKHPYEYDNVICVPTEDARLFAYAILKICDEIDGE